MSDQLMRRQEVEARCQLSCSTIYRLMRAGEFPEPLKVGPRAVRWRESEIAQFLEERDRASGQAAA